MDAARSDRPPLVRQLTFMAGNLPRAPFRTLVEAAAQAGFDSITLWPNIWRHALRKEGLTLTDMAAMLRHNGLRLTDADGCRDWVPAPSADSSAFGPVKSGIGRQEFFEILSQLGGTGVVAVHLSDAALNFERETEAFAKLCDDAADHGLRVGLEFVGFSNITDVATAWRIVSAASRTNGGLVVDLSHHVRSGRNDAALKRVPPERIFTVQICDGALESPHSLVDEAVWHRQWPGTGAFDAPQFLRLLNDMGVRASVGPELYNVDFEQRAPLDLMRELRASTERMLQAAGLIQPR